MGLEHKLEPKLGQEQGKLALEFLQVRLVRGIQEQVTGGPVMGLVIQEPAMALETAELAMVLEQMAPELQQVLLHE